MRRFGLAALFALFTLVGGGIAVFGTAGDRVMGIAVAMIFGGGGLAWWMVTGRHGRPRPGLQIGRVATSDGNEAAFVARSDRKVLVASVIGCLAIGAGMVLMILGTGDALDLDALQTLVIGGGGLLVIGVGLFGLMRLWHDSHFALTRRGVHAVGPAADWRARYRTRRPVGCRFDTRSLTAPGPCLSRLAIYSRG